MKRKQKKYRLFHLSFFYRPILAWRIFQRSRNSFLPPFPVHSCITIVRTYARDDRWRRSYEGKYMYIRETGSSDRYNYRKVGVSRSNYVRLVTRRKRGGYNKKGGKARRFPVASCLDYINPHNSTQQAIETRPRLSSPSFLLVSSRTSTFTAPRPTIGISPYSSRPGKRPIDYRLHFAGFLVQRIYRRSPANK